MKIVTHEPSRRETSAVPGFARVLVAVALVAPVAARAQDSTAMDDGNNAIRISRAHATTQSHHATHSTEAGRATSGGDANSAAPSIEVPMQGMDHSQMDGMDHSLMQGGEADGMEGGDHHQMQGMDMKHANMHSGSAPADARDPDYSDGVNAGAMAGMQGMHGHSMLGSVIVDRLEQFHDEDAHGQAIDAQAWYGSDLEKLWFKLDGERSDGRLGATRSEVLWNRAFAPYWGWQVGVRHDFGEGPGRNWTAFGFQGLSPYWFDVEVTAYVGESGRTALRVESEYEWLLTQRMILQPDVEVNFHGKNDAARGIGAGLSDFDLGLRLRYEVTRKFAPYVGVVWSRKFGKTADYARADSGQVEDTQLVAGVRLWF